MEANTISPDGGQAQGMVDNQSPCSDPEQKHGDHVVKEPEMCFKRPEAPFKVPSIPKVKPATSKPTAEDNSTACSAATSAERGMTVTGKPTPASDVDTSQSSPSSDGFAIPSSVAPRVPASSRTRQLRSPAVPPTKSSVSGDQAGGGGGGAKPSVSADKAAGGGPVATAAPAYRPPAWSGCPPHPYCLEVLRGGQIIDTVTLQDRPCVVFGRLADCDVRLEHPSISRHHAALVYRAAGDDDHEAGYYLFDLGSTHGSTLNKAPVQPKVYCRMRVGHMCKFGGSTRLFILQGPEEDREQESDLTVTELKELGQKREEERQGRWEREQERLQALDEQDQDPEEKEPKPKSEPVKSNAADDGISWGMAEDADEETDLQFNPFALGEAENEQLYLIDPKRTLRGWFEREGHELEYQTEELPGGRHICRITLPLDTADGVPPVAEAQHVGKKKEAVFQCALEACRLLDRAGVLRQAKRESRQSRGRRRPAGYDSDEDDTFLDRTGAVERKRQRRQQATAQTEPKADTYQSLLTQYEAVRSESAEVERRLQQVESTTHPQPPQTSADSGDADELDAFMTRLSQGGVSDRQERRNLRARLSRLHSEEARLCRLVNLARPTALPPLKPPPSAAAAARAPLTGYIGRRRGGGGGGGAARGAQPAPAGSDQRPQREEDKGEGRRPVDQAAVAERLAAGPDTDGDRQRPADYRTPADPGGTRETSGTAAERGDTDSERGREQGAADPGAPPWPPPPDRTDRAATVPAEPPERCQKDVTTVPRRKRKAANGRASAAAPYSELAGDGSYDVWMPPEGQSGDGRTSLNDKLGY